jgi:serine/threonine protein kinase
MKKPKEAPSFIRRKQIKSCYEEQGIKILKKLGEHCYLTLHPDSNFLLVMDVKNKKDVLGDRSCFSALRVYLKNCDIDHNLLVKYFGFLTDQDHICLFEEYLEGETLEHCINNPREDFNESTIGPIICSILTAIEYFRSIGKPYGIISPRNILYSMVLTP